MNGGEVIGGPPRTYPINWVTEKEICIFMHYLNLLAEFTILLMFDVN